MGAKSKERIAAGDRRWRGLSGDVVLLPDGQLLAGNNYGLGTRALRREAERAMKRAAKQQARAAKQ
jgi:hypothetical protein